MANLVSGASAFVRAVHVCVVSRRLMISSSVGVAMRRRLTEKVAALS